MAKGKKTVTKNFKEAVKKQEAKDEKLRTEDRKKIDEICNKGVVAIQDVMEILEKYNLSFDKDSAGIQFNKTILSLRELNNIAQRACYTSRFDEKDDKIKKGKKNGKSSSN